MTEVLRLPERAHVLEVGTGSAYQAAVLAEIAEQVFSVGIVPEALLDRLKPGARLVMPVGPQWQQNLVVVTRTGAGWRKESVMSVCFVPMTGRVRQVELRDE